MADIIQIRRDTAANWASVNPVLAQGEMGLETDTEKMKLGDGATAYNSLNYFVTSQTNVSISGGTIDGAVVGGTTPAAVTGTNITANVVRTNQAVVNATTAATTLDFNTANDFKVSMESSTTFTFNNVAAGQSGNIYLVQDAIGGHTFTLPAIAKTPVNGAAIVQDTGANNVSILSYTILDSSNVLVNYIGDFA